MHSTEVIELRQYTLHPGKRDVLIELFEREFVTGQEAVGIKVLGRFRDADDPDRFVWLRSFANMEARAEALQAFYGGPLWRAHRDAANATMIDSDNVLLLRRQEAAGGPWPGLGESPVIATICYFDASPNDGFSDFFEREIVPALEKAGASVSTPLVSEQSANTFPALPVREGENVFMWFASCSDPTAYRKQLGELRLGRFLKMPPEVLQLVPVRTEAAV